MIHGTAGFQLAYTLVLAAMLAGLIQARASWLRLLLSPLVAGPVMLVAMVTIALTSIPLHLFGIAASVLQIVFGLAVILTMGYAGGRMLATCNTAGFVPVHQRGAVVSPAEAPAPSRPAASSAGRGTDTPITLAGIRVPHEDETKHFKLIGTTGTGKSTAIREILGTVLARGDRVIIADPDGGYLARFHDQDRDDVILNPFERGAHRWDLFREIFEVQDIDQLARSLIPDPGDSDRVWSEYARTFFSQVMRQARAGGVRDDGKVLHLVTSASQAELKEMLAGTPAGPFLEAGNERMFGSVRSVASSALRALEYTTRQEAPPFSVRQWVRNGAAKRAGGRGGVLFFPYKAGEIAALRTVISAWMRLAIFEAMAGAEDDQRLWFVIDELDALGVIDGLKDALARLRKFGGRCVLGFQSIAQVTGTYGRGAGETIVENCGNTLILRCSSSEHGGTAEFASKLIGQREVLRTLLGRTRHPGQWWGSSTTHSQHMTIEPAVLASQIERLPDLEGFLKLASLPDWRSVRLVAGNEPAATPPAAVEPPAASAVSEPPAAVTSQEVQRAPARKRTRQKAVPPSDPVPRTDTAVAAEAPPPESETGNAAVPQLDGDTEPKI